jgi:hypothetical protein
MRLRFRLAAAFACLLVFTAAFGQAYTFNGNGDWANAANWLNGIKAPDLVPVGATVSITGTCSSGLDANSFLFQNRGTIIIQAGGSLTNSSPTQFTNQGSVIVYGTYRNRTTFNTYTGASVTVYGTVYIEPRQNQPTQWLHTMDSRGLVTIKNNGRIEVNGSSFNNSCNFCTAGDGVLVIEAGGTFANNGSCNFFGNLTNNGTLINNGILTGQPSIAGNLSNNGTLAPGSSPGTYTVNGNYTSTSASVYNFEVQGTSTTQYDRLLVSGTVVLDGALNVTFLGGFTPATTHDLPIITGTSITGTFSNLSVPNSYTVIYTPTSVLLRHVQGALPVYFVGLSTQAMAGGLNLNWSVAGEQGVVRYEAEQSIDGRNYRPLGTVPAANQSSYSLRVALPAVRTYFRIRSVDADGTIRYSPVVVFASGKTIVPLLVYPNPVAGQLQVQYPESAKGRTLLLYSASGQLLRSVPLPQGSLQHSVDVGNLAPGIYSLRVENQFTTFVKL